VRWAFTVFSLIPRSRAMSLLESPRVTNRSTSRSRSLSWWLGALLREPISVRAALGASGESP
jgi:hypothetical protein